MTTLNQDELRKAISEILQMYIEAAVFNDEIILTLNGEKTLTGTTRKTIGISFVSDKNLSQLLDLFNSYTKDIEREARIDELVHLRDDFGGDIETWATMIIEEIDNRIAELQQKQERQTNVK